MTRPEFEAFRFKGGFARDPTNAATAYRAAKAYRAEVVDAVNLIELELNELLCDALVGRDKTRRNLLMATILSAEFCGLFNKWRILRSVTDPRTAGALSDHVRDRSAMLTKLKALISMRNAFAHGEIVADARKNITELNYFEGEKQTLVIDEALMKKILSEASDVLSWLAECHSRFLQHRETV